MNATQTLLDMLPHAPRYVFDWSALRRCALGTILQKMDETPQNPIWHGEGNAGRHTRQVCDVLASLSVFQKMPERKQQILALAALLHDIGKIPNTRLADGQWTSPGHGPTGAQMARELLWKEFGFCGTREKQTFREAVCALIRYHALPVHILDQRDIERRLLKVAANGMLASDFSVELLCILAEADVRGRVADDTDELLELIALCRQAAQEAECLTEPGSFADAHTRRAYFQGRDVWRGQNLYDDTWGEVMLLSGLPGTGKDTWIGAHCNQLPVISLDEWRRRLGISPTDAQGQVIQAAQEQARKYLRGRQPFVWNATSLTESTRGKSIDLFENYGAAVRVIYLETYWEENLRRNAERDAVVPENAIEKMLGRLIPPQSWEAQRVEWICV